MKKVFLLLISLLISTNIYAVRSNNVKIITIDNDPTSCLSTKATPINLDENGLKEARQIAKKLNDDLSPLMPAAGLAAPQIGISKQIFIFSWDRSAKNIIVAINPTYKPVGKQTIEAWEVCFSCMFKNGSAEAALLKRHKTIAVTYYDLEGKKHKQILTNFAAKVFQHEYDHLQGIVNVRKKGAFTKSFKSKSEMIEFMTSVKKKDSSGYEAPIDQE